MRRNPVTAFAAAVGLCLIVAGVGAAVTGQWRVQLIRGSTTVAQGVGATEAAAWADCESKIPRTATAPTVYACQTMRYYATVTPDPVPPPPPAGTASLRWTPPTRNTDGSAISNLAGYRISYGTTSALASTIQVPGPNVSTYVVSGLTPGTYQFAVRAYTSAGTESDPSNVVSKTVQ